MSKFLPEKKKLLEKAYEKAEKDSIEKSFSGVTKYLDRTLLDNYKNRLSYKTFENYYNAIVKNGKDYNIKLIYLDSLSVYLGHENFEDFCNILKKESIYRELGSVKISISDEKENPSYLSDALSKIVINITNSPVFSIPEFISKNQNSLGIVGILILGGFLANKTVNFEKDKERTTGKPTDTIFQPVVSKNNESKNIITPQTLVYIPQKQTEEEMLKRKKECMYWQKDHYITIYCDQNIESHTAIAFNEDKYRLKMITRVDTLTEENTVGKV